MFSKKIFPVLICFLLIFLNMFLIRKQPNKCLPTGYSWCHPNITDIIVERVNYGSLPQKPINTVFNEYLVIHGFECTRNFDLVLLIKSFIGNFHQRRAIRNTWGRYRDKTIKMLFMLGYSSKYVKEVEIEIAEHKDILQGSFIDVYSNNIFKTNMAFDWLLTNCSQTDWVLLVDDDYFVNVPNIRQFINQKKQDDLYVIYGDKLCGGKTERKKDGKWYLSVEEYPYENMPPYISAGSVLLRINVAKLLRIAFSFCRRLWLDDVFVALAAISLNIELKHDKRFISGSKAKNLRWIFSSHWYNTSDYLEQGWNNMRLHTKIINKHN